MLKLAIVKSVCECVCASMFPTWTNWCSSAKHCTGIEIQCQSDAQTAPQYTSSNEHCLHSLITAYVIDNNVRLFRNFWPRCWRSSTGRRSIVSGICSRHHLQQWASGRAGCLLAASKEGGFTMHTFLLVLQQPLPLQLQAILLLLLENTWFIPYVHCHRKHTLEIILINRCTIIILL